MSTISVKENNHSFEAGFSSTAPTLKGPIAELSARVDQAARAPLSTSSQRETFRSLKQRIQAVPKAPGWQEAVLHIIRKERKDHPGLELERLKFLGIIDQETEQKLNHSLADSRFTQKAPLLKMMMGRALEIQKIYGSTHDVFIHSQGSKWLVYCDLIKELMKIHHPEKDLHHFKFLRIPASSPITDIEHYSKSHYVDDLDFQTRTDLISADGYVYNNQYGESALHYMNLNSNVEETDRYILDATSKAILTFYPHFSSEKAYSHARELIARIKTVNPQVGNLFIFCVPKEKSSAVQYRAHPYGKPCQCHPGEKDEQILDQLQKGNLTRESTCRSAHDIPQFRLFTPALKKENGVKSYLLTPDQTLRKEIKKWVRDLIQKIHSQKV